MIFLRYVLHISEECILQFFLMTLLPLSYAIVVILVIAWLIGWLGYHAGGLIHILLVIAIISILLRVIGGRRRDI